MASAIITLTGLDGTTEFGSDITNGKNQLQKIENLLRGLRNGSQTGTSYTVNASSANAVAASAEVTATTSGALGTVIGGTTVTTAFTTTQDGTATQAVTDINANATVNKWVIATKSGSTKFVVTARVPGELGNAVALTVTGTAASATGSGKLIGGTGATGTPRVYAKF